VIATAPAGKTPADIAAEVIGEVQPNPPAAAANETVVTPSGEVAAAVVVQDEPVAPEIVPLPEPVQAEPVAEIIIDPETQDEERNPSVNTLPGETAYANAGVSAEVEPASTPAVNVDEEPAAAATSQLPADELPRTAGLFDDVPQPVAPSPADAAAKAAEQENGEQRA
jgi:ribonuclease E